MASMSETSFEGIAKTNTTHTNISGMTNTVLFEGIAKTNTTHTAVETIRNPARFEGIAKTNTTHTVSLSSGLRECLRVLLKQIQPTHKTI